MDDSITRESLLASIAPTMKAARQRLGLTQDKLAEKLDLTTEFVARIERSKAMPSLENFVRIVAVLGVSAEKMLGTAGQKPMIPADPLSELTEEQALLVERIMALGRLGRNAVTAVLRAMEAREGTAAEVPPKDTENSREPATDDTPHPD